MKVRAVSAFFLVVGIALVALAVWRGDGVALAASGALAVLAIATLRVRGRDAEDGAGTAASPGPASGVLAAIPVPVVIVDEGAVVRTFNDPARAVSPGLRSGEPLAFALRAPEVLDGIRDVVAGRAGLSVEYGGRGRTDAHWRVRLEPLPGDEDGAIAILLFFHDLSVERRLETMRSDFIATASHELRTPLASILGFVDTLAGPARDDAVARARFLGVMREQAERMRRLLDDLLRLSRVEMHAHQAPDQPVDLGMLVREVLELMAPLAREREVEMTSEIVDGEVVVPGDRDELVRLVENLVENACRYGGSGGRVEVSLAIVPDGTQAELAVRDYGPGIAPEHVPRLTERFYRVDVADSRAQGGTGLGLAIVKHIVGRHRGRLSIGSEPGRGSTFTVRLPLM